MPFRSFWDGLGRSMRALRGFFPLLFYNAMNYVPGAFYGAYISAYYKSCGLPVGEIGVLTAIIPFVALLLQPMWGVLGDKSGRHMLVLRTAIAGCMLSVLLYYLAHGFIMFAVATAVYAVFNVALQPLGDTITIRQAQMQGYRFSAIRMGGTLGYAVAVVSVGGLLQRTPSLSFGMTSGAFLVLLGLTFAISATGRQVDPGRMPGPRPKRKMDFASLFKNKKILFIIFYAFVFQISLGYYASFLGIAILDLGYDSSMIGKMCCISAISEVPVLLSMDRLMRRFKAETLLFTGGIIMVGRMFLIQVSSLPALVICQLLQGVTGMVLYYGTVTFMNENLGDELRGTGQAVLCMAQSGLACLCSNILGGQLAQFLGLGAGYTIFASLLLTVTVISAVTMTLQNRRQRAPAPPEAP